MHLQCTDQSQPEICLIGNILKSSCLNCCLGIRFGNSVWNLYPIDHKDLNMHFVLDKMNITSFKFL